MFVRKYKHKLHAIFYLDFSVGKFFAFIWLSLLECVCFRCLTLQFVFELQN